jgi:hypothetical protein
MDNATETLLHDLEASPTDLKKLVVSALWRNRSSIAIESDAIARWERDDPHRWASVQKWLLSQGITITVLRNRSAGGNPRTTPSAPSPPPPESGVNG